MNEIERIPARVVARMIGVKTATLAKWRRLGKGPKGWIEVSPTHVTYSTGRSPASSIHGATQRSSRVSNFDGRRAMSRCPGFEYDATTKRARFVSAARLRSNAFSPTRSRASCIRSCRCRCSATWCTTSAARKMLPDGNSMPCMRGMCRCDDRPTGWKLTRAILRGLLGVTDSYLHEHGRQLPGVMTCWCLCVNTPEFMKEAFFNPEFVFPTRESRSTCFSTGGPASRVQAAASVGSRASVIE